jgi:hypothetical protein
MDNKKTAEQFVDQMRQCQDFRTDVRRVQCENELAAVLKIHGFGFKMDELARAMASCMDDLDRMQVAPSE